MDKVTDKFNELTNDPRAVAIALSEAIANVCDNPSMAEAIRNADSSEMGHLLMNNTRTKLSLMAILEVSGEA